MRIHPLILTLAIVAGAAGAQEKSEQNAADEPVVRGDMDAATGPHVLVIEPTQRLVVGVLAP